LKTKVVISRSGSHTTASGKVRIGSYRTDRRKTKEHNPKLVEEIQQTSGVVTEIADIREQLSVDDKAKVTDTIAEMQKTIREHTLSDELRDRVKVPQARPISGKWSSALSIEGKDSASGTYYTLHTGAAVTNSTNRYRVTPYLAAAANSIAQDILPRVFRIVVTANNGNAATYSVGYCLVGD
jgi:hypothetical protein